MQCMLLPGCTILLTHKLPWTSEMQWCRASEGTVQPYTGLIGCGQRNKLHSWGIFQDLTAGNKAVPSNLTMIPQLLNYQI